MVDRVQAFHDRFFGYKPEERVAIENNGRTLYATMFTEPDELYMQKGQYNCVVFGDTNEIKGTLCTAYDKHEYDTLVWFAWRFLVPDLPHLVDTVMKALGDLSADAADALPREIKSGRRTVYVDAIDEPSRDEKYNCLVSGSTYDIREWLKETFPKRCVFNGVIKAWEVRLENGETLQTVRRGVQELMEPMAKKDREDFKRKKRETGECDCVIPGRGRIGREPGKAKCSMATHNDSAAEVEKQRENYEYYKKHAKGDRFACIPDSIEEAICPACGVGVFRAGKRDYYKRVINDCWHCSWNMSSDY